MPTPAALREIIASTLLALAESFPGLREFADSPAVDRAADMATGLDGRRARKVVFEALSRRLETVLDPTRLTGEDLAAAVTDAIEAKRVGAEGA